MSPPKKLLGDVALPKNIKEMSAESQRRHHREAAISTERLNNVGAAALIQEPGEALIAFRTWLNHPANGDIQKAAAERITMNAVLQTVAAHVGYEILSAGTNNDVDRILGDLATRLQRRASSRVSS